MRLVEVIGFSISSYIDLSERFSIPLSCPVISGCREYESAKVGQPLGISFGALGAVYFLGLLVTAFPLESAVNPLVCRLRAFLVTSGLLVSLTLNIYGIASRNAICVWCLVILAVLGLLWVNETRRGAYTEDRFPFKKVVVCMCATFTIIGRHAAGVWMGNQVIWRSVPPSTLEKVSSRQISGSEGSGKAFSGRRFIALYNAHCGSCIQSLRMFNLRQSRDVNLRLEIRFVGAREDVDFDRTVRFQFLALGEPRDLVAIERAMSSQSDPYLPRATLASSAGAERHQVARHLVVESLKLIKDLEIKGFPVVLEVLEADKLQEVNPMTFEVGEK